MLSNAFAFFKKKGMKKNSLMVGIEYLGASMPV
jgi:hypothetical protein